MAEEIIFKEGDHDCSLCIVLDGEVELYHQLANDNRNVVKVVEV